MCDQVLYRTTTKCTALYITVMHGTVPYKQKHQLKIFILKGIYRPANYLFLMKCSYWLYTYLK